MDDKYVTASAHLRFTVSAGATAYVCLDRRASRPPTWLGTWTATTLAVSTTDGAASPMRVYSRSLAAGSHTLGGNHHGGDTGARANYFVVLQPAAGATSASTVLGLLEDAWEHEGDRDGDGLGDDYESAAGLDPDAADSDGDGEPDEEEAGTGGASHWDLQAAGPAGPVSPACGALGAEVLLLCLLRRRRPTSEAAGRRRPGWPRAAGWRA
jgi:hypothetical protein